MKHYFDLKYSVAIRTLGKAHDKYLAELKSIERQTVPPKDIFVYLAEGYEKPKETIGKESIIYCKKGMIAQRSLSFDEIDTEYILFLDDDIELAPESVERLFTSLNEYNADCIFAELYNHFNFGKKERRMAFVNSLNTSTKSSKWLYRVKPSSGTEYTINPTKEALPSQTGCGGVILCKKTAYTAINFAEEQWLDKFAYPLGEDHLFLYKLHSHGFKVLGHINHGIKHLDAGCGSSQANGIEKAANNIAANFVIWWRTQFSASKGLKKAYTAICFGGYIVFTLLFRTAYSFKKRKIQPLEELIKGLRCGWNIVHSKDFKLLRPF